MLLVFEFPIVLHGNKRQLSAVTIRQLKPKLIKKSHLEECLKLKLELNWPRGEDLQILPRWRVLFVVCCKAKALNPAVTGSSHCRKAAICVQVLSPVATENAAGDSEQQLSSGTFLRDAASPSQACPASGAACFGLCKAQQRDAQLIPAGQRCEW